MIRFELCGRRLLSGSYTGKRRRKAAAPELLIVACPCGYKTAALPLERAERALVRHIVSCH